MSQVHDSSTADVRQKLVNIAVVQVGQAVRNACQKTETQVAWMLGPLSGGGTFSWQPGRHGVHATLTFHGSSPQVIPCTVGALFRKNFLRVFSGLCRPFGDAKRNDAVHYF